MLKEAMTALDKIHKWFVKYPRAPVVVPKKDWISIQNTKFQLCIKIQSKEKLAKDVDRVITSYRHLFSSLESMIQLHGAPSLGEVGQVRKKDEISKEVQAFVETYKQTTYTKDLPITKENVTRYVVESVRIYTELVTLKN